MCRPEADHDAVAGSRLLPEPVGSGPDHLIGHVDTTFEHQLLHVAEAQREPVIQPDATADDLGRKPEPFIRRACSGHDRRSCPPTFPAHQADSAVARLTPRYLATSRAVCPSPFIRRAVATWAGSATLVRRPNLVPLARETPRFKDVRSFTSSRSNSAMLARTPITMRPAAVDESMPSVVEIRVTPASVSALTVSRMWSVLRPRRSSFQTTTVSPSRTYSSSAARPGRSSRAPDIKSENTLVTPATASASFC